MQAITADEIMTAAEYDEARPELRRRIMVVKSKRRVPLGEHMTVHFETRETMLYQVHEMLRAEGTWDNPDAVRDELDAYNPLVPFGGELSATVMLEYETKEERDEWLGRLLGLDEHLWLHVGETEPVQGRFDQAQVSPTRISSVQYVRFPLDEEQQELLKSSATVVRLSVDHPAYQARSVVSEETRQELVRDIG
jgi:hypothetical protein